MLASGTSVLDTLAAFGLRAASHSAARRNFAEVVGKFPYYYKIGAVIIVNES